MNRGWFVCSCIALILSGCGPKTSSAPTEKPMDMKTPLSAVTGNVEVVAFKGGYDIDFYQQSAKEFAEKHAGVQVKVDGNPRVWEQLRPRFVKGDVPDLMFPGWGMDHWALKEEGQLTELTEAMKSPSFDGSKPWGDTFIPAMLKLGQQDGKQWVLPYYYSMFGWWTNAKVFKANGWTAPKTWDELLTLCDKIKAKGIAPITFQGQYPFYMLEGMLLPWAISAGGNDMVKDLHNLKPGAWKSPAIVKSASMIAELRDRGFFQSGAVSMSHTESQQEFVQGKAAMIPCGTWLYSEMKKVMPPDTEMEFFVAPAIAGGAGDPSAVMIGIEPWMVPSKAKNARAAVELYKYMTSLEKAKQFVKEKGTLVAIVGSDQIELPEVLKAPAAAMNTSKFVWSNQIRAWYPEFEKEIENSITALLNKSLTPETFADRLEAAAEKVRNDPKIKKHTLD